MEEDDRRLKSQEWYPEAFVPRDAIRFGRPTGSYPPEPVPGAWDHEHCVVCQVSITPHCDLHWWGYRSEAGDWLCVPCYRTHISRRVDPPPRRPPVPGVPRSKPQVRPWKRVERKGRRS